VAKHFIFFDFSGINMLRQSAILAPALGRSVKTLLQRAIATPAARSYYTPPPPFIPSLETYINETEDRIDSIEHTLTPPEAYIPFVDRPSMPWQRGVFDQGWYQRRWNEEMGDDSMEDFVTSPYWRTYSSTFACETERGQK
jgi:hypothetical protein